MERRRLELPPPPLPDFILAALGRIAESIVDTMAQAAYAVVSQLQPELGETEKRAIAYALVGDLVASPLPPPLDAPIDTIVQERLRTLMPDIDKYRRMAARVAEAVPYLELLPSYLITVLATIREREMS